MVSYDFVDFSLSDGNFSVVFLLSLLCGKDPAGFFGLHAPSVRCPSKPKGRKPNENASSQDEPPTGHQQSSKHLAQPRKTDAQLVLAAVDQTSDPFAPGVHPFQQFFAGSAKIAAIGFSHQR